MKLSTFASLLLAFCLIYMQAASGALEMKGVSKDDYLDLMETAVGAYSDEHLARYLADVEKNGVQEHPPRQRARRRAGLRAHEACRGEGRAGARAWSRPQDFTGPDASEPRLARTAPRVGRSGQSRVRYLP